MVSAVPVGAEASPYPYLDLAVMDVLRGHIISPNAAIVFSPGVDEIWWANAAGVSLLGADSIRDALEGEAALSSIMRRQIQAATRKLDHTESASAVMRVSRGMKSVLLGFTVTHVTLPRGDEAILLLSEVLDMRDRGDDVRAQAAVDALAGYGSAAAVLGPDGNIIRASATFNASNVDADELHALCCEVADEDDRLVKRTVRAGDGDSPAGIARLHDDPPLHLLVIASDGAGTEMDVVPDTAADVPTPIAPLRRWYFNEQVEPEPDLEVEVDETPRDGTLEFEQPSTAADRPAVTLDTTSQPVRFVWDMDAEKRFGATSPELVQTVGRDSGNVAGMTWTETAERLGFENGAEIEALIDKGDTWSGKTVSWPIDGTDVRVPVDLAGLPAYGRDRVFEGFNGFGIIRLADAVAIESEIEEVDGLTPDERETFEEIGERLSEDGERMGAGVAAVATMALGAAILTGEDNATDEEGAIDERAGEPVTDVSFDDETSLLDTEDDDTTEDFVEVEKAAEQPTEDAPADRTAGIDLDSAAASAVEGKTVDMVEAAVVEPSDGEAPFAVELQENTERPIIDSTSDEMVEARPDEHSNEETVHDGDDVTDEETDAPPVAGVVEQADHTDEPVEAFEPLEETRDADASRGTVAFAETSDEAEDEREAQDVVPASIRVPDHTVDTSILARLPIPVLVYRDDELLFANPDFNNATGYPDLHALAEAGGVERLFGGPDDRLTGESASPIFHANGDRLPVRAHIQRVPWDANPAMLLTLRPGQSRDDGPPETMPEDGGGGPRFSLVEDRADGSTASFGGLDAGELRGIVDTASDGVLILSPKGTVQAASRSAEALFDRPAGEIEGAELASLLAPESRDAARDYLDGLLRPGLARLLNDGREIMLRTPRGGLVPVFMTIGPLGESTERFCAVMRDITPWKRSEEDLLRAKASAEEASQQKSHFLARISHEIRTPLNAIIGFSDIMVAEKFGRIESDRYRGYLRDISRSGHHVLDIVNDLLDISKIEAGELDLTFDSCDLNTIVSNTVAMMQADANKDRVIIRTSLSAAVPKVVADPRSLRQVILNLVSNGIKYTRAGGQVIVSTVLDEGGAVTLRVRDTGIGMSRADLEQAMQPFRRITTTAPLDRQPEGSGLGLPLTRALVEANRAQFHIESEPEEGTLVEVRFQTQRVLADR